MGVQTGAEQIQSPFWKYYAANRTIKPNELDDVAAFCSVIEQGSFTGAARALGRPKSSVSAAVARLETDLNARLLQRTTRRVSPTEAGTALYQDVGPAFERLREIEVEAKGLGSAVAGTLRIAAPYEFGAHHIGAEACAMLKD